MLQGAKICLFQCSYEAPAIFSIIQLVLGTQSSLEQLKQASGCTSRSLWMGVHSQHVKFRHVNCISGVP